MKNPRPRITLVLTPADRSIEYIGWALLAAIWIWAAVSYAELPETIPTHFNFAGDIDNYGSRSNLFILPIISIFLFVGLTYLNRFPHIFNYPAKIDESNAQRLYTLATRMLRLLKTMIMLLFFAIDYVTIKASKGEGIASAAWVVPSVVLLIMVPVILYTMKMYRER